MRHRRFLPLALLVAFLCTGAYATVVSPNGQFEGFPVVRVVVNGQVVQGDVPGINFGGRTLIPARLVTEALGATVDWNPDTWTASIHLPTDVDLQSRIRALQNRLVDALKRIEELESDQTTGNSSGTVPGKSLTERITETLGPLLDDARIEGTALSFSITRIDQDYGTWMGEKFMTIFVEIDDGYWPQYDLVHQNNEVAVRNWFEGIGGVLADLCSPQGFCLMFFYHGSYISYPSSFYPGEIRLGDDLKWHVAHNFAVVENHRDKIVRVTLR